MPELLTINVQIGKIQKTNEGIFLVFENETLAEWYQELCKIPYIRYASCGGYLNALQIMEF